MKKSLLKNLIALSFALGALVFVVGNVYADDVAVGTLLPEFEIVCDQNWSWDYPSPCWERQEVPPSPCAWHGSMNVTCDTSGWSAIPN